MSNLTEKQRAFHLKKMLTRYKRLDLNHDGFTSREDYELMATKLQEYGRLDEKRAELSRNAFKNIADVVGLKAGVKIPVEEAARNLSQEIETMEVSKKQTMLKATHNRMFDAVDLNKDGYISLDEFKIYFQIIAPDISDAEMIHSFNTIDEDKNGEISRDEFIVAASEFFFGYEETEISKAFFGPLL